MAQLEALIETLASVVSGTSNAATSAPAPAATSSFAPAFAGSPSSASAAPEPQVAVETQVDVATAPTSTVTEAGEAVTTGGNPAPVPSDELLSSLSAIIDQLQSLITQLVGSLSAPAGGDDY